MLRLVNPLFAERRWLAGGHRFRSVPNPTNRGLQVGLRIFPDVENEGHCAWEIFEGSQQHGEILIAVIVAIDFNKAPPWLYLRSF